MYINFKGGNFRGIVNKETGEIIYSHLSPVYHNVLDANIRINIHDEENYNNREVIQKAKEVLKVV